MLDYMGSFAAFVYNIYYKIDNKICHCWMRLTGRGRKSYFAVMTFFVIGMPAVIGSIENHHVSWVWGLVVPIYAFLIWLYCNWLDSPEDGLSTVKIKEVYFNTTALEVYTLILFFNVILLAFVGVVIFYSPGAAILFVIYRLLSILFWVARTHSGPPKPDNTYWAKAKSKVKETIEAHRKPKLVPIPLGV